MSQPEIERNGRNGATKGCGTLDPCIDPVTLRDAFRMGRVGVLFVKTPPFFIWLPGFCASSISVNCRAERLTRQIINSKRQIWKTRPKIILDAICIENDITI
jgi:hypothetical protein